MAVRGSSHYYHLYKIQRRHWIKQGELTGLGRLQVESMMDELYPKHLRLLNVYLRCCQRHFHQRLRNIFLLVYGNSVVGYRNVPGSFVVCCRWVKTHNSGGIVVIKSMTK